MTLKPSEFELISTYFEGLHRSNDESVQLAVGDDCALISPPPYARMAISVDTMVEGTHFPVGAPPEKLAVRALSAALSDLAAMGAEPSFITLSLTLPEADKAWISAFADGVRSVLNQYGLSLVGGDTTKGPLAIGVQVHGYVREGSEMLRSNAQIGDLLIVTGTLGDAGAALALLDQDYSRLNDQERYLLDRYYQPTPRFAESCLISPYANACIDVSDGLVADARHIAKASDLRLRLALENLPVSPALRQVAGDKAEEFALSSGDDYELFFTVPEHIWQDPSNDLPRQSCTVIGKVVGHGAGIDLVKNGQRYVPEKEGFDHFG